MKIDYRQKWIIHALYIILEYIALFSLIGIALNIDRTWGWLVSISFWLLLASLIYLYWDNIMKRKSDCLSYPPFFPATRHYRRAFLFTTSLIKYYRCLNHAGYSSFSNRSLLKTINIAVYRGLFCQLCP